MKNKKLFKYIPITIMTAGAILAAVVYPSYFQNNSGTPTTQVFNDNQQVNDADYTDQLDYIRSDVAKLDGVTNTIKSIKLASNFWSAYSAAAIVTKTDDSTLLYTWGNNGSGQLGLGDSGSETNRFTPTLVDSKWFNSPITQIALGGSHSAALLENGSLYTWGNNDYGQLGLGDTVGGTVSTPAEVTALLGLTVTQIVLGANHSAALLKDGSLYTWGCNEDGQLGLGNKTNKSSPTEVKTLSGLPVTQIALGGYHSAALLKDDILYTWGDNDYGQLGLGDSGSTGDMLTPAKVNALSSLLITQIVLGANHSAALLENGSLYTWGTNDYGQLGLGDTVGDTVPTPTQVPSFSSSPITQIVLGGYHSAALLENGSLYTWGNNGSGQLGLDDAGSETNRYTPAKVNALSSLLITQIVLGANHSAALLENGSLYTWGWNLNGQLGLSDDTDRSTPTWMPYLGKDSHITADDTITAKKAVDSFWVNGIFDPEGFKNSFNLINIPDGADQEITMVTVPTYNNSDGTVTMKVKFKYYYDKDGLAVADTSTDDMTIGGFNLDTRTTNITFLSEPRADLTPTNFKEQLEKDGAVVAGDQYTLSVTNITFLEQFLKIEDVPVGTIYTLNINPNQTDDATGVLSFKLSLNQYFSDGTLKIEPYDDIFNLNLLSAPIPTPVESNTFPWWWILVGIGGAAIIGVLVWLFVKKQKDRQLAVKQILQRRNAAQAK